MGEHTFTVKSVYCSWSNIMYASIQDCMKSKTCTKLQLYHSYTWLQRYHTHTYNTSVIPYKHTSLQWYYTYIQDYICMYTATPDISCIHISYTHTTLRLSVILYYMEATMIPYMYTTLHTTHIYIYKFEAKSLRTKSIRDKNNNDWL